MMITIEVVARTLSDSSLAYDVVFESVLIPAITYDDAERLASKLSAAVAAHSNEDTRIVYTNNWR